MMFRLMYRLKKKHGAVLFAVIAVMALLIAMSTAAYYTARGSYNTVASSYNYSQLYLSAIASADMVSAAIMNQPVPSAVSRNNFDTVKNEMRDHLNNNNDVIYLKTSNLSAITVDGSTSQQAVINALNAANDPAEPGVLDGLTVAVKVLHKGTASETVQSSNTVGNTTTTVYSVKEPFTYEITTTAYYRDNTITVQDILTGTRVGSYTETDTYTPGGSPSNSLPSDFNPNIATGQNQPNTSGQWEDANRTVVISVKEINGDMAFRNKVTVIGGNANLGNVLNGGLVSEGSVYLKKGGAQVTGTDNNWYIKDDLVITDAQAFLDLGQNDLYVGGDLVISANGGPITARDIYVNGDLVILNQKNINVENLHVNGNIYFSTYDEHGNLITDAFNPEERPGIEGITENYGGDPGYRLGGNFNLSLHGNVHTKGKDSNGNTVSADKVTLGKYQNLTNGATHSDASGIQDFKVEDNTKHDFTVLTTNKDTDKYEKTPTSGSTLDALMANTNYSPSSDGTENKSVYPNYTAGQTTYDREVTIDFSLLEQEVDANGNAIPNKYKAEFEIEGTGETVKVTLDGARDTGDISVQIPYVEGGFVLKYATDPERTETKTEGKQLNEPPWWKEETKTYKYADLSGVDKNTIHYNIDTGAETMPIVLAANKGDGNFSWTGDSGSKGADVSVNGSGKVTFEMGNKNKDTGEYEPFKVENADKYEIPTYVQGKTGQQFSVVGSAAQVAAAMNGKEKFDNLTVDQAKAMPQRSNVMLVSNKSGEAFNANGKDGLFCGYIYAPNGTLYADNQTNGEVINVGSIVISAYEANHANYQVSLPTPQDMTDFIDALGGDTGVNWGGGSGGGGGGGNGPGSHDIDTSSVTYTGLESWTLVGSNYIGDQ